MHRRSVLKSFGVSMLGTAVPIVSLPVYSSSQDSISLRLSGYDYDRVMGLIDGSVEIEGSELEFEIDNIGSLNTNALGGPMTREATEVGMVPFILAYENGGLRNHSLIPVFPLRIFRHKSIYIRPDRGIKTPEDLRGKRIATPGYSSTSLTWIRGLLQDEYGVTPNDVQWVVSKKDSASKDTGDPSEFESVLPDGLKIEDGAAGMDESDLLVEGEVDALFHAAEPKAFVQGNPNCIRLFADSRAAEQDYYKRTGIFPIMHAVAVRNDVIEMHPWLPEALFKAYSKAKAQVYSFQRKHGWYKTTQPWISQDLEDTRKIMGDNFYSYGFTEENRKTLNALFRYCHEQGFTSKPATINELFHSSTLDLIESTG